MASSLGSARDDKALGLRRLTTGAGLGLGAAVAAIVIPVAFLALATYLPGGFFVYGPSLVQAVSILVLAGAVLFVLSLVFYRRGFLALRHVDRRFSGPATLCVVGSVGFLLVLLGAAALVAASSTLLSCLHGRPLGAIGCLRSSSPLGAYATILGFWLGWLGGVGVVWGLGAAGRRFATGAFGGGAGLYAILLVVLAGPFVALVRPLPEVALLVLAAPVFAVLAPGLVLFAARSADPGPPRTNSAP